MLTLFMNYCKVLYKRPLASDLDQRNKIFFFSEPVLNTACRRLEINVLQHFLFCFGFDPRYLPIDPTCPGDVDFQNNDWDIKTITSAMKFYLRCVVCFCV